MLSPISARIANAVLCCGLYIAGPKSARLWFRNVRHMANDLNLNTKWREEFGPTFRLKDASPADLGFPGMMERRAEQSLRRRADSTTHAHLHIFIDNAVKKPEKTLVRASTSSPGSDAARWTLW
ncbi:hypothetical protein B0H19DRAFT_1065612 [Mycena capillaripes]|nr:hypothetical protein B0H19DRAFT_1065612 [Mycena capillaripes]